ncbi:MAG: PP2C family protein-serine/threonine phosphatase, partial [Acidimicrobiales bacterium]
NRAFAGESVVMPRRLVGLPDVHGRRRVMRYSMSALRGSDGMPVGVIQFIVDATDEVQAQQQAVRSRLVADISAGLMTSDDAGAALETLVGALVPEVADLAAVYAYAATGGRPAGGGAPTPPVAIAVSEGLGRFGPPPAPAQRHAPSPWDDALQEGRAFSIPVDGATLTELTPDAATREWLSVTKTTSIAVVPLVIAGEVTGGVLLLASGDRRPFGDADLELFEDVTARAGAAISEVRARERTRQVAERLQRALLPGRPPQPPGLVVAARYVPGGHNNPVGGDWWDVLDLGDGSVGLGIGDISGHGIGAAALMGQARVAMRAAGQAHLPPAEVLGLLDLILAEAIEQEWGDGDGADLHRFATALYALAHPTASTLRVSSAGHLPILVRPAVGAVRTVWAPPGPPLGLGLDGYDETLVTFSPGDLAVAFTDGLVEDRRMSVSEGIDRLVHTLDSVGAGTDLEVVADELLAGMGRLDATGEDDVALLIARSTP